jgi:hypothetical protein
MDPANRDMFMATLEKCGFESGGVPVIVIGDKCEQGYADFMQDSLRESIEVDLNDEQKAAAAENKKAMAEDAEKFKAEHAERASAVTEYSAVVAEEATTAAEETAPATQGSTTWFYALLIVLVAGLGYVLVRKDKKK